MKQTPLCVREEMQLEEQAEKWWGGSQQRNALGIKKHAQKISISNSGISEEPSCKPQSPLFSLKRPLSFRCEDPLPQAVDTII